MKTAGGIVLCGGLSTRMGSPKATLPFGPETMLQRVVRLLSGVVSPIAVAAAGGQDLPDLPPDIIVTRDALPQRGPLEGLCAGFRALPPNTAVAYATGCDVPLLVPAFVTRMIDLLDGYDVAVVDVEGFPHPLAGVYRRAVLPNIDSLLSRNQLRATLLLDLVRTRRVTPEEIADVDPELLSLRNLNTPDEYRQALLAYHEGR